MMFAQVSDDNDDTVRSWSLTLADTTHIHIFPVTHMIAELSTIRGAPEEIYGTIT